MSSWSIARVTALATAPAPATSTVPARIRVQIVGANASALTDARAPVSEIAVVTTTELVT